MNAIDAVGIPSELSLAKRGDGKASEAEALKGFEAYFLGELMRIAMPKSESGLMDGGQAGRMYQEHYFQELARVVAAGGGVGIAASLAGRLAKPEGEATPVSPDARRAETAPAQEVEGR
ncbi:MAG: rod-binding protein [Myxococcota bacterium]